MLIPFFSTLSCCWIARHGTEVWVVSISLSCVTYDLACHFVASVVHLVSLFIRGAVGVDIEPRGWCHSLMHRERTGRLCGERGYF
ncbi:hypothetical protein FKM82_009778 [Ascaphus truei]